jgi:5-methylcytosine-specific restriction endonuclease McrA
MALHVALDVRHETRMDEARGAALARDAFSCQACGARGPDVVGHLRSQPRLLPSYDPRNVVALCGRCHDAAHR